MYAGWLARHRNIVMSPPDYVLFACTCMFPLAKHSRHCAAHSINVYYTWNMHYVAYIYAGVSVQAV